MVRDLDKEGLSWKTDIRNHLPSGGWPSSLSSIQAIAEIVERMMFIELYLRPFVFLNSSKRKSKREAKGG